MAVENLFKKVIKLDGSCLRITIHSLSHTEILNTGAVGSESVLAIIEFYREVPPWCIVGASQFQGGFSANTNALLIRQAGTMRSPSVNSLKTLKQAMIAAWGVHEICHCAPRSFHISKRD